MGDAAAEPGQETTEPAADVKAEPDSAAAAPSADAAEPANEGDAATAPAEGEAVEKAAADAPVPKQEETPKQEDTPKQQEPEPEPEPDYGPEEWECFDIPEEFRPLPLLRVSRARGQQQVARHHLTALSSLPAPKCAPCSPHAADGPPPHPIPPSA